MHKLTPFFMGLGRNYRMPPATILTYSSLLVHIHILSDPKRTPVASTTHLAFLKNLPDQVQSLDEMYTTRARIKTTLS